MMDIYQILKQLPHRFPILLVDRVLEIEKGVRIKALKNVSVNEPYFRNKDVCTKSGNKPRSAKSTPPRFASASPDGDKRTSTQPVNKFFAFHSDSPWRNRMSLIVI